MTNIDKNRIQKLIDFLKIVEEMKKIKRGNYLKESERAETDAEHVYHLCMFLLIFEKELPTELDKVKMMKMALIHDLAEIYAGDEFFVTDEEAKANKKIKEMSAAKKVFSNLPDDIRNDFLGLFTEYEEQKTPESKYVSTFDKIQAIHQNLCSGWLTYKKHDLNEEKIREYHRTPMKHSELSKTIYQLIFEEAKEKKYIE